MTAIIKIPNAPIVTLIASTFMTAIQPISISAAELCTSPVESGWAAASNETEAKRRAILWWSSRAGAMGRGYENWDRARRKSVSCRARASDGLVRCKAIASPCLPEGILPQPKPGEKFIEL